MANEKKETLYIKDLADEEEYKKAKDEEQKKWDANNKKYNKATVEEKASGILHSKWTLGAGCSIIGALLAGAGVWFYLNKKNEEVSY